MNRDNLEQLCKKRDVHRTLMTSYCENIEKMIKENSTMMLRPRLVVLDNLKYQLDEVNVEIKAEIESTFNPKEDFEVFKGEYEARLLYDELYADTAHKVHIALENIATESSSVNTNGSECRELKRYALPKVQLPRYDGGLETWMSFWAQFEKIHLDNDIHNADKFQYLTQSIIIGSDAHRLVSAYPQTAENYPSMINAFKNRFGDETLLAEYYIKRLSKSVVGSRCDDRRESVKNLYDEIQSNIRTLDTLGLEVEESAWFLYPLIEGRLPEEILRAWQRSMNIEKCVSIKETMKKRMFALLEFMEKEVKNAMRMNLVKKNIEENKYPNNVTSFKRFVDKKAPPRPPASSAICLLNAHEKKCAFCNGEHRLENCRIALKMTFKDKIERLKRIGICFKCLQKGHVKSNCNAVLKCTKCDDQDHLAVMCTRGIFPSKERSTTIMTQLNCENKVHSQLNCTRNVLLQTLCVVLKVGDNERKVRILLDPGSQRSYVLNRTVEDMKGVYKGQTQLCHMLFGGTKETKAHRIYDVQLICNQSRYTINMEVLGQKYICGRVPRMQKGVWMHELEKRGVFVEDVGTGESPIELLIGSDYYGSLLCGRTEKLMNGIVAIETHLGWCLSGKMEEESHEETLGMSVMSLPSEQQQISKLWNLDILGITDPIEQVSRKEKEAEVMTSFLKKVKRNNDGRYMVKLPWMTQGMTLPSNKAIAVGRLKVMTRKLINNGRFEEYDQIFKDWLNEGLIEPCNKTVKDEHFLPHRAVYKPNSLTTPIRPVFDASCRTKKTPSLNDCLEKGPNLLELIPSLLLRFRENKIGVTADIRKAFQMIEVDVHDRNCLRFLWWRDNRTDQMQILRHTRVVFGVKSSPFLLAAVIEHHLSQDKSVMNGKLIKSFYVDNCVTSVDSVEDYLQFKEHAINTMEEANMELRQWCRSREKSPDSTNGITFVLGIRWNTCEDVLSCEIPEFVPNSKISKRAMLSFVSRIFDPVGFLAPATLSPKLILQETWSEKLGWEQEVPEHVAKRYISWCQNISHLRHVKIPRYAKGTDTTHIKSAQLHVFADASKEAYAAVVFLRTESVSGAIFVQLLMAKARVAPLKKPTIPRLELMSCLIAARLANTTKEALDEKDLPTFFWTDSTTALAWIHRNAAWGTFVGNRVKEICILTDPESWRHIPGKFNPADLPSRGCEPHSLLDSRWWEGPDWLRDQPEHWPKSVANINEEEIRSEEKKTMSITLMNTESNRPWYLPMSQYSRNIRMVGWIRRWLPSNRKRERADLTLQEFDRAELTILRLVQKERNHKECHGLVTYQAEDGLVRLKTRLCEKLEIECAVYPILLPARHLVVDLIIDWYHKLHGHAGTQFMICKIREKFWLPRCRKNIQRIIRKCQVCRRHVVKSYDAPPTSLPLDRMQPRAPFQTTGVDLAGPLFLRNGRKVWFVIFTCSVFRGVHLDLVTSISTESFLEALERFMNIRGRPTIIYSDNGTNFVGTANLLKGINWKELQEKHQVKGIKWIFNPPSAAWWGGWWERLIRTVKELLKRMLGRARLDIEQLRTHLSHAERTINDRPLTTATEDPGDLIPLTPSMFLTGSTPGCFRESSSETFCSLKDEFKRRHSLREELERRFKNEYLSLLVQRAKQRNAVKPRLGDVVLVGSDNKKRLSWPLGRIVELFPGQDGHCRVAKVMTRGGLLIRPIQKLYPMEMSEPVDEVTRHEIPEEKRLMLHGKKDIPSLSASPLIKEDGNPAMRTTKSGRVVRRPGRFLE